MTKFSKYFKNEKLKVILFFAVLTIILTWPVFGRFFSSVASSGPDTMQVIGVAGNQANVLADNGVVKGTIELVKSSDFNLLTIYAYFQLIFGRIIGYNLLFFLSFILSGFGAYLLADYLLNPVPQPISNSDNKNRNKYKLWYGASKPAALIAGIIFAFSPFHIHNAISTNVGTMHQEWLPFFALYLFRFFDDLKLKNFIYTGIFLLLIGLTEHQLLAFTAIFLLFFLVYKIITQPKVFLNKKVWLYSAVCLAIFAVIFFFMFRTLFKIAGSDHNYLDAGFKSAVKYSNDTLSVFIPPPFHSFWPNAFSQIRNQFERRVDSNFSVYIGFSVLLLSILAFFRDRNSKKWFWLTIALGFYVLSLGPYLHYKGLVSPPVKMPYIWVYDYLPFYKNIRTVGRLFIYASLAFSLLAAGGLANLKLMFSNFKFSKRRRNKEAANKSLEQSKNDETEKFMPDKNTVRKILTNPLYSFIGLLVILEFTAIPLRVDDLRHSSFYEKLGKDKENYSVLEVPGSTSYNFASRDLVWKSIHRKNTINGYDFARVAKEHYTFQRGTPIIRTLLYEIGSDSNNNDRDIMKSSYYEISSEILNYYNVRYVILDRVGLKGDPAKGELDMFYPAKGYIKNVIKCADEYEDEYLYACRINSGEKPNHMFLAMDYANTHWVKKSNAKNGIQRSAENGAGVKLINMTNAAQNGKFSFSLKVSKPLRVKVFLNGAEVFNRYLTTLGTRQDVEVEIENINPGENDLIFGVYGADGSEIKSDKKADTVTLYNLDIQ